MASNNLRDEHTKPGKRDDSLLQTLSLHSTELQELVKQAMEIAKTEDNSLAIASGFQFTQQIVYPSNQEKTISSSSPFAFVASEDSADSLDDEDSSESSTNSTGDEEKDDVIPQNPVDLSNISNISASTSLPRISEESPTPSATAKEIQHKKTKSRPKEIEFRKKLKHHASNVNLVHFKINDESQLGVPAALFTREELVEPLATSRCQALQNLIEHASDQPVIVLLLRSGRFAGGVFQRDKCVTHATFQRYTVRKGQGKAQSAQDGNRRPKSMGSQLRRAGEESLKEDMYSRFIEWKKYFDTAAMILVSCPKPMRAALFGGDILTRKDDRLRSVPFDVGRPTFEGVNIVHQVLMQVQQCSISNEKTELLEVNTNEDLDLDLTRAMQDLGIPDDGNDTSQGKKSTENEKQPVTIPVTPLHVAAERSDLDAVQEYFTTIPETINMSGGFDFMTPLHFAAASTNENAAQCAFLLLIDGQADPTKVDARLRLPYHLASSEKVRESFRKARAILGEGFWDWNQAKVGPPLTEDDIKRKKEKEADKKKRKRAKQKQKKKEEQLDQAEAVRNAKKEEEMKNAQHEASKGNPSNRGEDVCDFCHTKVKGRKKAQMFHRLEYRYCSSECVQKHKRELMAQAAMARFG